MDPRQEHGETTSPPSQQMLHAPSSIAGKLEPTRRKRLRNIVHSLLLGQANCAAGV